MYTHFALLNISYCYDYFVFFCHEVKINETSLCLQSHCVKNIVNSNTAKGHIYTAKLIKKPQTVNEMEALILKKHYSI